MTVNEMIKKFKLELAEKDGKKGIRLNSSAKPTPAQITEIKSAKAEIIEELKKIEVIKKEQRLVENQEREIETEKLKAEYIKTANLKRYLVCYHGENMEIDWSIETLELTDKGIAYRAKYFAGKKIELPQVTEKIKKLNNGSDYVEFGMAGMAYEITDEQEAELVAEQAIATVEAERLAKIEKAEKEKQAEIKKAEKEAKRIAIFAKAKLTGVKQELYHSTDECNDPSEECNLDMIYGYAMPDGETKETRTHTW